MTSFRSAGLRGRAASTVTLPYRWFRNIIHIQEKKTYSTYTVLLFCFFVGIARVLGEWFMGARELSNVALEVAGHLVFYWYSFFTFGLPLFLLVPQPWRKSINVVLIGIFLGVLPPVFDLLIYDIGAIRYSYFWAFPREWSWGIYNPAHHFHFGESFVLWLTIGFTAAYVGYKTRSVWRAAAGGALAYAVVAFNAGALPASLRWFNQAMGWDTSHLIYMVITAQVLLSIGLYAAFQPRLFNGLLGRTHHSLPFVVSTLIGSAFAGVLNPLSLWTAFLVWLMFQTALIQNDFYDVKEDARQGRPRYADAEDVAFVSVTAFMLAGLLVLMNSAAGMLLLLILVLSSLYSFPFYRGKRYFPSNLKMEGGWGLSSFLAGMLTAMEFGLTGQPHWALPASPAFAQAPAAPGLAGIIACFLVFGGHSVLAMLKDYKDVDADAFGGVQTVYTLAKRRGIAPARVHRWVSAMAAVCLALPVPLLFWAGKAGGQWLPGGLAAAALLAYLMHDLNEKAKFDRFLWATSAYLVYVLAALRFSQSS